MLILTRRPGESIVISISGSDKQIEVVVLSVKSNQVRIGTDAPAEILIIREELLDRHR